MIRMEECLKIRIPAYFYICLLFFVFIRIDRCQGINCAYCAKGCNNATGACEACVDGFYGDSCNLQCATTCHNCERGDGKCNNCFQGFYGDDCSFQCTDCQTCDIMTGSCTECHPGKWGPSCGQFCSENCYICNITTGECEACALGFYGENCTQQCGNCRRGLCERTGGNCVYDCDDGWFGDKCDKRCRDKCMICDRVDGACSICSPNLWGEMCDQTCDVNCDFCNATTGICLECKEGFYGERCTERCGNCLDSICDKITGQCAYQCQDGWHGLKCDQQCIANCTRCVTAESCIVCQSGLAGDKCDVQCPDICSSCMKDIITNQMICSECRPEYKLPRKNCSCSDKKCVRFEEDWSGRVCTECENNSGWYLHHGTCCPCLHCLGGNGKCSSNGTCIDGCEPKYYPKDEGCDKYCDIPHCIWCETFFSYSKICVGCESGYYPSAEGCERCSDNCKGGYLMCNNQTGVCLNGCEVNWFGEKCESNCNDQFCEICESKNSCLKCKDGFWGHDCFNSCPVNCISCDNTTGECLECKDGYYGTGCTKSCQNCLQQNCTKQGICESGCIEGWYGGRCDMKCMKGCARCTDITTCQMCTNGAEPVGNSCDKYCETCVDGKCDSLRNCQLGCVESWYGEKCSFNCISGCQKCVDSDTCEICKEAHRLNGTLCYNTCEKCIDGTCDGKGICTKGCRDGWYGNLCDQKCQEGCKSCKNADSCEICEDNYRTEFNMCIRTCSTCIMEECNEMRMCTLGCRNGWYGDTCESNCSLGCDECYEKNTCTLCKSGFILENNQCKSVCSNCLEYSCNAEEICTLGCVEGWFGVKCNNKCSEGCLTCTSNSTCTICETGYVHEGTSCRKKCENCLNGLCDEKEICKSGCIDGWFGERCNLKCNTACKTCHSSDMCATCDDGQYGKLCEKKCPATCNSCKESKTGDLVCWSCTKGFMIPRKQCTCSDTKCVRFEAIHTVNECVQCTEGWFPHLGTCCPCLHCNGGKTKCNNNGCTNGCEPGWYSDHTGCDQPCGMEKCVQCGIDVNKNICKRCEDGYYPVGDKCTKCSKKCGGEQSMCDSQSGRCLNGCITGWQGEYCNASVSMGSQLPSVCSSTCLSCSTELNICKMCKPGYWGASCEKQCSRKCKYMCDQVTGECTITCSRYCHKEETDVTPSCNLTTGLCLRGCMNGWYGPACRHRCGINCFDGICDQNTGNCINGCDQGWKGQKCNDTENLVVLPGMGLIAGAVIAAVVLVVIFVILGCFIWKCRQKRKERKREDSGSARYPVFAPTPYINNGLVMDSVM